MVRQFLPGMMERNDGHIVAISSVAGFEGLAKCAPYAASKSGLNGEYNKCAKNFYYKTSLGQHAVNLRRP